MKFLIEDADGANHFIILSYVHALQAFGHQVCFWNAEQRSCYDMFDEFSRDGEINVYFGHTWKLNRAIVKNLIARPNIKVILRANHYGELDDTIDLKKYPVGVATDEEKKLVEELKNNHPNFKYVTCQYSQQEMERSQTHNRWERLGLTPKGILLCADVHDYFLTPPSVEYSCDVAWAGSYWPYKSKYASWLYGLCYPNANLRTRISGNGWSTPANIGIASESSLRNLYASAKVCPNLFEPHSIEVYSDLNQRLYQTSICGGFQISQKAIGIEEVFPENEIVMVESRAEFYEKVMYYVSHPEERLPYIFKAARRVYQNHTNFHRTADVLELLEYYEEAKNCLDMVNRVFPDQLKDD